MGCLCNEYISEALKTARRLMGLANSGELLTDGDDCCVLFGVMRDCAHKIKKQAERERLVQEKKSEAKRGSSREQKIRQIE